MLQTVTRRNEGLIRHGELNIAQITDSPLARARTALDVGSIGGMAGGPPAGSPPAGRAARPDGSDVGAVDQVLDRLGPIASEPQNA